MAAGRVGLARGCVIDMAARDCKAWVLSERLRSEQHHRYPENLFLAAKIRQLPDQPHAWVRCPQPCSYEHSRVAGRAATKRI